MASDPSKDPQKILNFKRDATLKPPDCESNINFTLLEADLIGEIVDENLRGLKVFAKVIRF
jgi:hypothetical protein